MYVVSRSVTDTTWLSQMLFEPGGGEKTKGDRFLQGGLVIVEAEATEFA